MSPISICIIAAVLTTNIKCQDLPAKSPYPSQKPWFDETLPSRSDIVNVTIIYHINIHYSNIEVRAGVGQIPQALNDLQKNTQLCGTSSRYMARLGNYQRRTIFCQNGISADYIIIQVGENISPILNAVLVNNIFLPTLKKAYNLTSSGGCKTKYPQLIGVYKLTDKVNNFFPVYKQDGGPGMAYVDFTGNWVVGEEYTSSLLYSKKHPISPSPPATEWQYKNLGWDGTDPTLLMVPIDPEKISDNSPTGIIIGITFGLIIIMVGLIYLGYRMYKKWKEARDEIVEKNPEYEDVEAGGTAEIVDFNPYYEEPEEDGEEMTEIVDYNPEYGRLSFTEQSIDEF